MMPIGPQEPEDMMRVVHMNPVDAFEMTKVLGARTVFPIHWGAFAFGTVPRKPDVQLWRETWTDRAEEVQDTLMCVLSPGQCVEWDGQRFVPPVAQQEGETA
jgi:L-ascorbate metabolism protein UlaG (beta-lactamase superfamily)